MITKIKFYSITAEEAAKILNSDPQGGLTDAEAKKRLAEFGPN